MCLEISYYRFYFYCLQTKFAKVMFSQLSVCPLGVPNCMLGYTYPLGRHLGQIPLQADTPPGETPLLRSECWDMVNKQAVCIPLECILVMEWFFTVTPLRREKGITFQPNTIVNIFSKDSDSKMIIFRI